MRNIEADKVSGKYRVIFEDVRKDLNDILNQYTFNDKTDNLEYLKSQLSDTMYYYIQKIYKVNKGE